MLNLSQPMHYLSVVRGGKHSTLRSHAYFFKADPGPPAQLLPRDIVANGIVGVSVVGALTTAQKAATLRKYDVRVARLRDQLSWYKLHNRLYTQVEERQEWEADAATVRTRVVLDITVQGDETSEDARSVDAGSSNPLHGHSLSDTVGALLHSTDGNRSDELDRSMWRHNAPAPAILAERPEDEDTEQSAVSLISDFAQADGITGLRELLEKKTAVVYRSTGIISDFDKNFWVHAYSELFPFGRGGLDEPRSVSISLPEFVKHCMRLSSRRHPQHPSFCLVAFDVIARHNAANTVNIKAKMAPSAMESAGRVSRDALMEYSQFVQNRVAALKAQRPVPEPPVRDSRLWDLYSSISTGMRAYWGSNEERSSCRRDLLSMQLRFWQPTVFFTLSPDCSSTLNVGALSGVFSEDVLSAMRDGAQDCIDYSRARLGEIATSNPYQCARFFDMIMQVFIGAVLNWDLGLGCAQKDPGLFGRTKAFYSASESQSSTGSLHAHMLIWVENMPSTVEEYYALCGNDRFRRAMIQYVDTIASSNVPLDTAKCLECGGQLTALPLQQRAFHKPSRGVQRPATSKCLQCGVDFGASELITQHCRVLEPGRDVTSQDCLHQIAGCQPLPASANLTERERATCARALLFYQHHNWYHSRSCFKITRRTPRSDVCGMFMHKEPCTTTRWTDENRIEPQRNIGDEYLNTYVPVVNSIFRCNHDIKPLGAGEGPEKAYYMMKYTTKYQQDIANPTALHLHAFDKAVDRFNGDPGNPVAVGRHRVQSMCCLMTNPHEVSPPMACLYLLNGSVMYSSHKFSRLNFPTVLKTLFDPDEEVDAVLEEDASHAFFRVSTLFHDYVCRPSELANIDLMGFVSQWERKKSKSGKRFLPSHPHHATHSLFRRVQPHVVTLSYKRLPDVRKPDLPNDELLRFQRTVMVLFRPFCHLSDLHDGDSGWKDSYDDWWATIGTQDEARVFVRNNIDYSASRELTRSQVDLDAARYGGYAANDVEFDDLDPTDGEEDMESFPHVEDDMGEIDFVSPAIQTNRYIELLEKSSDVTSLAARSIIGGGSSDGLSFNMDLSDLNHAINVVSRSRNADQTALEAISLLNEFPDIETRVRMLEDACSIVDYQIEASHISPNGNEPERLKDRPTLLEVSRAHGLNEKQQKMFTKVGEHLFLSMLKWDHSSLLQL